MKKEKNRVRNRLLKVYVANEEYDLIKLKMNQVSMKNFSAYARKMLIDLVLVKIQSSQELNQLTYEINKIGVNINQITKLANENKNINNSTINDVVKIQQELQQLIQERVAKIFGYN